MRRFAVITIMSAAIVAMFSCNKSDEELTLQYYIVDPAVKGHQYSLWIAGGSGDFSAETSDPNIATATIGRNDEGKRAVIIVVEGEGDAVVTVTDKSSGYKAECLIRGVKESTSLRIGKVLCRVDAAGRTDEILEDMKLNAPYQEGSTLVMVYDTYTPAVTGTWAVSGGGNIGSPVASGDFAYEEMSAVYPAYMELAPITDQIYWYKTLKMTQGSNVTRYAMFCIRGKETRSHLISYHFRLYEDLTQEYRAMYPDADVKAAVRVLVLE